MYGAEVIEATSFVDMVAAYGIVPAIVIAFGIYYLRREKNRDETRDNQIAQRDELWKEELKKSNETFKGLVDVYLAEGTRREQQLREDAERREDIIRKEAEKRETILMRTIDGFSESNAKLSNSINEMSKTLVQMELRMTNIETNQKKKSN